MQTPQNPLVGTPLHRCLLDLQTAQTHLGEDLRSDYEAAGRLVDADAGIADAIAAVRKELNSRYAALKAAAAKAPAKPAPATFALEMPGPKGTKPVMYQKTKTGITEMFDFVSDAMNDGGVGIVALNYKLFDRLAEVGFKREVDALRAAASEILDGKAEAAE